MLTKSPAPRSPHELAPHETAPCNAPSLHDDQLRLLGASIRVDGRLSWYPPQDMGRFVPFNAYLLKDGEDVLMVESGVPATFEILLAQLSSLTHGAPCVRNLAVTRNEPDCVANVPLLVRHAGLQTVNSPGLMNTLQFFPADDVDVRERSFTHRSTELQMLNFGVRCAPAAPGGDVPISDHRSLRVLGVPLRVLPTVWFYDAATRTMFCSDTFSDETAPSPDERILTEVDTDDVLTARFKRSFRLKFDWLEHSDLVSIIEDLERIFDRFEIETLAPSRGLVIHGKAAVAAKIRALMTTLHELHAA